MRLVHKMLVHYTPCGHIVDSILLPKTQQKTPPVESKECRLITTCLAHKMLVHYSSYGHMMNSVLWSKTKEEISFITPLVAI